MSGGNRQRENQTQSFNNQSTTNWGFMTPPDTPDFDWLRGTEFDVDPTIGSRVGAAARRIGNQFLNPAGAYTTPGQREAIMRSQERELMQEGGAQYRAGAYDVNRLNYARNLAVAGLTAPQLVQTGSTSSGTGNLQGETTTRTSPWGTIAQGAGAALGAASL